MTRIMKLMCTFIFSITLVRIGICSETECMAWALRKIIGPDTTNQTNEWPYGGGPSQNEEVSQNEGAMTRGSRPGKRGAVGPPGERGLPGPPGTCDCIPEEVRALQRENEDLKEKLDRVRKTSPETYCLLGVKSGSIPPDAITVSSYSSRIQYSRLDASDSWFTSTLKPGDEWIMADLGDLKPVTGVVTQGRPITDQWVKTYKVEHSVNGTNFIDVKKSDGSELVFMANTDRNGKVVNHFPEPVVTRFIRIYPLEYQSHMCMRFDIVDC